MKASSICLSSSVPTSARSAQPSQCCDGTARRAAGPSCCPPAGTGAAVPCCWCWMDHVPPPFFFFFFFPSASRRFLASSALGRNAILVVVKWRTNREPRGADNKCDECLQNQHDCVSMSGTEHEMDGIVEVMTDRHPSAEPMRPTWPTPASTNNPSSIQPTECPSLSREANTRPPGLVCRTLSLTAGWQRAMTATASSASECGPRYGCSRRVVPPHLMLLASFCLAV